MKTAAKPELVWSDAWLLASIYGAGLDGKQTLSRVIGAGDTINHAIFTVSELNGGISRLLRRGLIQLDGAVYRLTEKGAEITEIDSKERKGPFNHMETVRRRLHVADWGPHVDPNACDDSERDLEYVSEAQVNAAFEEYSQSLKRRTTPKPNKREQSPGGG